MTLKLPILRVSLIFQKWWRKALHLFAKLIIVKFVLQMTKALQHWLNKKYLSIGVLIILDTCLYVLHKKCSFKKWRLRLSACVHPSKTISSSEFWCISIFCLQSKSIYTGMCVLFMWFNISFNVSNSFNVSYREKIVIHFLSITQFYWKMSTLRV